MMTSAEFQMLRDRLEKPRPTRITPVELAEALHPHTPAEDPAWPTPRLLYEARRLLRRLPHRVQLICGLTLAEMVLPVWEDWAGPHADVSALRRTVDCLWRWLDGRAGLDELKRSAVTAEASSDLALDEAWWNLERGGLVENENAFDAKSAADAVDHTAYAAYGTRGADDTAYVLSLAVNNAAKAVARMPQWSGSDRASALRKFMERWWARCRCRLAFDMPEAAELM